MPRVFGLVVVLLLALGSAAQASAQPRFALVIGHNEGRDDDEPLRFAERDARKYRDALVRMGGVPKNDAVLLLRPSAAHVLASLSSLAARVRAAGGQQNGATVFLYFGGHGDEDALWLGGTKLERERLKTAVSRLGARLTVSVIDACELTSSRTRGMRAAEGFEIGVPPPENVSGGVVIRATRRGEPAQESDRLGGAVFTHYWISALRGAGDSDGDGRVTLLEAYRYAYHNTVRYSVRGGSIAQHPSYELAVSGWGDVILTRLSEERSAVLIPKDGRARRYLVYDARSGTVIGEATASTKGTTRIALPAGRFVVQRWTRGELHVTQVELPYGGTHTLREDDFERGEGERLVSRGGNIELRRDALALGYVVTGELASGTALLRQGAELAYRRAFDGWSVEVLGAVTFMDVTAASFQTRELRMEGRARLAWDAIASLVTFRLFAGGILAATYQTREHVEEDRLRRIGIETQQPTSWGSAFGGELGVQLALPLWPSWDLELTAGAQVLGARIQTDSETAMTAIPGARFGLRMAARF